VVLHDDEADQDEDDAHLTSTDGADEFEDGDIVEDGEGEDR